MLILVAALLGLGLQDVKALDDAHFSRSAGVLLAKIASDRSQPEATRTAALDELAKRAQKDPATALFLAHVDSPGKVPPALAVSLAREHLTAALQLAPIEEGSAFAGIESGPSLQTAAEVTPQPLDPELSTEMGARPTEPQPETKAQPTVGPETKAAAMRELDTARSLAAQVPAGDPSEAAAHEVAGLAALAEDDQAGAAKEFTAVANLPVAKGDSAAEERRSKAYLQLARLAYAANNDEQATQLYERVSRNAPQWLDALFEASWSRFRRTEDEMALGNLLTLQAPFFQYRFFPEAFVLRALVLYENCRYADAKKELADFDKRYQPLHDGLADYLKTRNVSPAAKEEIAHVSADYAPQIKAAGELQDEMQRVSPEVAAYDREARQSLLDGAARGLDARLDFERSQLRELLGQSLRISYEIAGREKELLSSPDGAATAVHNQKPKVKDDEELWPFEGEYWRDELGSYRYQLGMRCRKPRVPPQTAATPPVSPSSLAADPK